MPKHFSVRQLKTYEAFFGEDVDFAKQCQMSLKRNYPGPVVDAEFDVDERFLMEMERTFITAPLGNTICVQQRHLQLPQDELETHPLSGGSMRPSENGVIQLLTNIRDEVSDPAITCSVTMDDDGSDVAFNGGDNDSCGDTVSINNGESRDTVSAVESAYSDGHHIYSSMCELVRNQGDLRVFLEGLTGVRAKLMSR